MSADPKISYGNLPQVRGNVFLEKVRDYAVSHGPIM